MSIRWNVVLSICLNVVRCSLIMMVAIFALTITLQSLQLTFGEVIWGMCLLCMLYLSLIIHIDNASESTPEFVSNDDAEHLLQIKPVWQHSVSTDRVSMGTFIRVGQVPAQKSSETSASTTSSLEHLIAVKKKGYWLTHTK